MDRNCRFAVHIQHFLNCVGFTCSSRTSHGDTVESDQALGQALRHMRTQRKWSQTTLAQMSGTDRNYISLIEMGRSSPSVRIVFRLCAALDVSPSDLLRDTERRLALQPHADQVLSDQG